jgi:hypothetical protein
VEQHLVDHQLEPIVVIGQEQPAKTSRVVSDL